MVIIKCLWFSPQTEVEVTPIEPQLVVAGMEPSEFTNVFPIWTPRPDVTAIQEKVCYLIGLSCMLNIYIHMLVILFLIAKSLVV